ncbi:hypothetical protein PT286_02105 [Neisseriaceae bacterium ESL0693]|nr:hypothetical protein [Neisseriaceae bacterium ESL0693]
MLKVLFFIIFIILVIGLFRFILIYTGTKMGIWAANKAKEASQNGSPRARAVANSALGYAQRHYNPIVGNSGETIKKDTVNPGKNSLNID